MGRVILVLLAALVAAFFYEPSRTVILETAGPLANPAFRWMSNQEMKQIVADLELLDQTRGDLPYRSGEFDAWLDSRYPQPRSREDAWGTRYRLEVVGRTFRVIAAGPDGEFGTEDDLVLEGDRAPGPRR